MKSEARHSRPIRFGVSGPTGSGKSTFAGMLSSWPDVALIRERITRLGTDDVLDSWLLQKQIIKGRRRDFRLVRGSKIIVFDRTIAEDREVFFSLHAELNYLSCSQVEALRHLSQHVEAEMGVPDIYVVLFADVATLRQRMERDKYHTRPKWLLDSIELQVELYDEWRRGLTSPNLQVDTSDLGLHDLAALAARMWASLSHISDGYELDAHILAVLDEFSSTKMFGSSITSGKRKPLRP